jgi:hypothetical protein
VASNRTSTVPLTLGPIVTPQPTMICPAPLTELSVRDLDLNGTVVGYAAKVVEPVVTDIAVVQHWTRKHREGRRRPKPGSLIAAGTPAVSRSDPRAASSTCCDGWVRCARVRTPPRQLHSRDGIRSAVDGPTAWVCS